jgi:hypothetical protein
MMMDEVYTPCLRTGASELNALSQLEVPQKNLVAPLLFLAGNDWEKIENFIEDYAYPLWIDSSNFKLDESSLVSSFLNNPDNKFENKTKKFNELKRLNRYVQPVVSLNLTQPPRETIYLIKTLIDTFSVSGIRINITKGNYKETLNLLDKILLVFDESELFRLTLFVDFGKLNFIPNIDEDFIAEILSYFKNNITPLNMVTISTSVPPKPRGIVYQECLDIPWHEAFKAQLPNFNIIYGDYAATSPTDYIESNSNMRPRPMAVYLLKNLFWYVESQGKMQEFNKFVDIAKNIRNLEDYHGDNFCWANREIKRISEIVDTAKKGYGGQPQWNEIKIHQHICAILYSKANIGYLAAEPF